MIKLKLEHTDNLRKWKKLDSWSAQILKNGFSLEEWNIQIIKLNIQTYV